MPIFGAPNVDKLRAQRNLKGLTKALRNKNADVRGKAAEALGEIADASAVEPLVASLEDENKNVRWKGAEALHNMGWEPKSKAERIPLLIAMRRWDELMRAEEPSIRALIECSVATREYARHGYFLYPLAALWEIGPSAVPPLIDALCDQASTLAVRVMAGLSLGVIGDTRAIEPLVRIFRDRNEDMALRESMGLALQCMGEAVLQPMIATLTSRDADDVARVSAVANLAAMGEPAIEGLADALRDERGEVRAFAVFGLAATGHPKAIKAIRSMPEEKDTIIGRDIDKLLDLFDPPSLDQLLSTVAHFDPITRRLAAIALGNIGDCNAVESLTRAFRSDSNDSVQTSASFSLGKLINCPGVRDTFVQMLGARDEATRLQAAVILKLSGVPVLFELS